MMTTEENLQLLAHLDRKDAQLRRRTARVAWGSVAVAAAALGGLIFGAYQELARVQKLREDENRNIVSLRKEKSDLNAEIASLKPLVENYKAFAASQTSSAAIPETAPPAAGTNVQPRVYLQIAAEADREYAGQMGKALAAQGFKVMGIEYVKSAAGLRNTEVRYYKKAEAAEAGKIVETLRQTGDSSVTTLYLGLENSTKVRPRHYEVWFRAQSAAAAH